LIWPGGDPPTHNWDADATSSIRTWDWHISKIAPHDVLQIGLRFPTAVAAEQPQSTFVSNTFLALARSARRSAPAV
jgi:hypothetical protein